MVVVTLATESKTLEMAGKDWRAGTERLGGWRSWLRRAGMRSPSHGVGVLDGKARTCFS